MKTNSFVRSLFLLMPVTLLAGCAGFNTTLFMTKSNAGLDLDSKPPTAEINISRKEGVVEPLFEGGKTPPVMASFSLRNGAANGFTHFFFGVNQTFSGGDAAVTMAKLYDYREPVKESDENIQRFDSSLPLSVTPKANRKPGWFGWRKKLFGFAEPGEVRPFFFGTDTQLGIKVGWNGVGGPYPDNVKIGFNRKEMAVAPVTLSNNVVRIPSFLATVDSDVQGGSGVEVGWLQYFATGESADFLARQYGVRKAMLQRADPKAGAVFEDSFIKTPATVCLRKYWKPDGKTVDADHETEIKTWMTSNGVTAPITMLLYGQTYKDRCAQAVKDLKINCDQE